MCEKSVGILSEESLIVYELVAVLLGRFKITTEKPTGAISGLQHVVDGSIEWSYNLPHSCQLSQYVST